MGESGTNEMPDEFAQMMRDTMTGVLVSTVVAEFSPTLDLATGMRDAMKARGWSDEAAESLGMAFVEPIAASMVERLIKAAGEES